MKNWKYIQVGNFTRNYRYKDFLITNPEGYEYIIYLKDGLTVAHIARDKVMAELWCDAHDAKTGKLRTLQPKAQKNETGNAEPKVTDISGKDGSGVVERMSNQFFVSYKLNNGEKGIEKFPTEAQAVEFLKKKVGNDSTADKLGLKPLPQTIYVSPEAKKEIVDFYEKAGRDINLAKQMFKEKHPGYKDLQTNALFNNVLGGKVKSANESIYKQEASMFGGLGKKAEKEIGNYSYRTDYEAKLGDLEAQRNKESDALYNLHESGKLTDEEYERKQRELIEKYKKLESKIGNETKGERKFGKVMGEFEEGALKTPQGKTVTDPAQAKAIAYSEADKVDNLKRARNAMKTKNRKAIGTHFDMNDYGIDVGPWSWDWKGQVPDKKTMQEIARKIKDYARQIDKDVPEGDSDERDEVFAKLDRFMQTQGLK